MHVTLARTAALGLLLLIVGCQGQAGPTEPTGGHRVTGSPIALEYGILLVVNTEIRGHRTAVRLQARQFEDGGVGGLIGITEVNENVAVGRGIVDCLNRVDEGETTTVWIGVGMFEWVIDESPGAAGVNSVLIGARDGSVERDDDMWTGLMVGEPGELDCEDPPVFSVYASDALIVQIGDAGTFNNPNR